MAEDQTPTTSKPPKSRTIIWVSFILAIVAAIFLWNPFAEKGDTQKEPVFHRDEPVKEQILEHDYQEKIKEMIDSGMTVAEISKETGLRKDLIRKIKKEMGKGTQP